MEIDSLTVNPAVSVPALARNMMRKHAWQFTAFVGGFLFDVVTLGRIDDLTFLISQTAWIATLSAWLVVELLERESLLSFEPWSDKGPRWRKVLSYRDLIPQFLFGGLLSVHAIFYFKSADGIASWIFVGLLALALLANETPHFTRSKAPVRFGLLSLCVVSFFMFFWPIVLGWVGSVPFALGILSTLIFFELLQRAVIKRGIVARVARRAVVWPASGVLLVFMGLYLLQWIPPVPLSAQKIGIYHNVEKVGDEYRLSMEAPQWKIWWRGDEVYHAQPGDRLFVFTRIFAPRSFRDEIRVRWAKWVVGRSASRWEDWDSIPLTLVGGRENGFRGFAFKSNFEPGQWRVSIETSDGREIASMKFDVVADLADRPRVFRYEFE